MPTISVIIPALNEKDNVQAAIETVRHNSVTAAVCETIVVDGGSDDGSPAMARKLGAAVLEIQPKRPGRAELLNAGAGVSKGDILFFLDADSLVPPGYDKDILTTVRLPGCVGGAFEFKLKGKEAGLRVVEIINRLRYRIWPWYYGDQGIFVSREAFDRVGGFPPVMLMEASDFCRELSRYGELRLVHKDMLTSARRFLTNGIYRVLGFDIRMWWRNLTGKDVEQFANEYWNN